MATNTNPSYQVRPFFPRRLFKLIINVSSFPSQGMFYAVVVTGAPRETTEVDIRKFFEGVSVTEILFPTDERGWRTGNSIYVQLESSDDFEAACLKDGHLLLSQKVGVLMVSRADYERVAGGRAGTVGGATSGGSGAVPGGGDLSENGTYSQGVNNTVSLTSGCGNSNTCKLLLIINNGCGHIEFGHTPLRCILKILCTYNYLKFFQNY